MLLTKKKLLTFTLLPLMVLLSSCSELSSLSIDSQDSNSTQSLQALAGSATPSDVEAALLVKINEIRATGASCYNQTFASSGELIWNIPLAGAAKTHVKDVLSMYAQGEINIRNEAPPHTGSDGQRVDVRVTNQGYDFKTVAENLASSSDSSPYIDQVMSSWLSSTQGHCDVLLRDDLSEVGLYFENGVWAAVFGDPK